MKLLTVPEAARRLHICTRGVWRLRGRHSPEDQAAQLHPHPGAEALGTFDEADDA